MGRTLARGPGHRRKMILTCNAGAARVWKSPSSESSRMT
jgi:hypothetical protein